MGISFYSYLLSQYPAYKEQSAYFISGLSFAIRIIVFVYFFTQNHKKIICLLACFHYNLN